MSPSAGPLPELTPLMRAVEAAGRRYHRLLFVVGESDAGRRALLGKLVSESGAALIQVSLNVSERLLPEPRADRIPEVGFVLEELIASGERPIVCLDAIEVLTLTEN